MDWKDLLSTERLRHSGGTFDLNSGRNDYESDLGRVIFSPALRRMHDKTQVFPLSTDDNIHTRLTHSMEVMSVGYSLGIGICRNEKFLQRINELEPKIKENTLRIIPIILKTSCLLHDIGNPPFGHFGETVIQNYFRGLFTNTHDGRFNSLSDEQKNDFIHFDGNAQGFRVITKLQALDDLYGLNLTFASLASYIKYPNTKEPNKNSLETKKTGVCFSESEALEKISKGCGLVDSNNKYLRHPLSYLMEAADSICYSVIDIEDAFNKGIIDFQCIQQYFSDAVMNFAEKDISLALLQSALEKINDIVNANCSRHKKIVDIRTYLIGIFVDKTLVNFINNLDDIEKGEYNKELIDDGDLEALTKVLQNISTKVIFPYREIVSLELTGDSVLKGLFNYYIDLLFYEPQGITDQNEIKKMKKKYASKAESMISASLVRVIKQEHNQQNNNGLNDDVHIVDVSDYLKLKLIVDFVSGMTDLFAVTHYQKLNGQKI